MGCGYWHIWTLAGRIAVSGRSNPAVDEDAVDLLEVQDADLVAHRFDERTQAKTSSSSGLRRRPAFGRHNSLTCAPTMSSSILKLGVNIDHIATLREARYRGRGAGEPDPVAAAAAAEAAGCHGITAHLREDRRHIQDRDVWRLRETVKTRLNLEMANTPEIVTIALTVKPEIVIRERVLCLAIPGCPPALWQTRGVCVHEN